MKLRPGIEQVHEANLIEDEGIAIAADASDFVFDLRPFEIKTFTIRMRQLPTRAVCRIDRDLVKELGACRVQKRAPGPNVLRPS